MALHSCEPATIPIATLRVRTTPGDDRFHELLTGEESRSAPRVELERRHGR
jgi:hypothetical protein